MLLLLLLLCSSSPTTTSWPPDPVDHNSPGGSPAQLVIHGWWHQPASSTLPTSPKPPLRLALRLLLPCSALALCLVHQGLVLVQGLVHKGQVLVHHALVLHGQVLQGPLSGPAGTSSDGTSATSDSNRSQKSETQYPATRPDILDISSQTRQRQWEKSVIFLQEILLLRIEKSFYISHWKSVAVPFLGSTRAEVESAQLRLF